MNRDVHAGLARDLTYMAAMPDRRQLLTWLGAAACLPVVGCTSGEGETGCCDTSGGTGGSGETDTSAGTGDGTCELIPTETEGPYPGDGSNGPNVLVLDDVVRSDIRTSIGSYSGTAAGLQLTIRLRIVDTGCSPRTGYAVYLWHCNRDGEYSMYDVTDENYLRGVQVTDDDGWVTFVSIFPGCYAGRWPHIHFEVYPDLASTGSASNKVATSQLALPEATCVEVYATTGYDGSVRNFEEASLETDNVFGDGADAETPTMTGDTSSGFTATLSVGV